MLYEMTLSVCDHAGYIQHVKCRIKSILSHLGDALDGGASVFPSNEQTRNERPKN